VKVPLFDKRVRSTFGTVVAWAISIFSVVIVFFPITSDRAKWIVMTILLVLMLCIYIIVWIAYNHLKSIKIKIRQTRIVIKEGDLFSESGQKVIAFNEYFDTQVDDIIIAKGSLNGQFITKNITDVKEFDNYIRRFLRKNDKTPTLVDNRRKTGKKEKYELGTVVAYNDYFFVAYAKFDEKNRAYLNKEDLARVYINMWTEIDRYKACNSIVMPVLGSNGMVRKIGFTPQQMIEMLLWSFRISDIDLTRTATLKIVVHKSMVKDIDFSGLKAFSD